MKREEIIDDKLHIFFDDFEDSKKEILMLEIYLNNSKFDGGDKMDRDEELIIEFQEMMVPGFMS